MARVSIEDCLDFIENRFALVSVASDRARKLMDGAEPLIKAGNKEAVLALREIAEGLIVATTPKEPVVPVAPEAPVVQAPVVAATSASASAAAVTQTPS